MRLSLLNDQAPEIKNDWIIMTEKIVARGYMIYLEIGIL